MGRMIRVAVVGCLIVVVMASGASAIGYGHVRDGWAYGLNLGVGWTQLKATDVSQTPALDLSSGWEADLAGGLRVAFSPSDEISSGLDFSGWTDYSSGGPDYNRIKTTAFGILAQGHWYPGGQGFYLRGGLGLGSLGLKLTHPAAIISQTKQGLGWGLGAGWEVRVSPSFALGVAYDYRAVNVGSVTSILDDVSTATQSATISLTWYPD